MDRNEAYRLLTEYTKKEGLIKHALAVEAAMREYAKRFKEDQESWGIVGLLHDFDYEKYPDAENHPFKGAEILREPLSVFSHCRFDGECMFYEARFFCVLSE